MDRRSGASSIMSGNDTLTRGSDMYAYRCAQCRTTSPDVVTKAELSAARQQHRDDFHGGHIPDGEQVLEPAGMRFADLPREQKIATVVVALILLVGGIVRFG